MLNGRSLLYRSYEAYCLLTRKPEQMRNAKLPRPTALVNSIPWLWARAPGRISQGRRKANLFQVKPKAQAEAPLASRLVAIWKGASSFV